MTTTQRTSEGAPGSRLAQSGAGGELTNQHAAQRGSEALASFCPPLRAPSLGATFPP